MYVTSYSKYPAPLYVDPAIIEVFGETQSGAYLIVNTRIEYFNVTLIIHTTYSTC